MEDIDESAKSRVYLQKYGAKPAIDGVLLIPVKHTVTEDGDFSEILRVAENGEFKEIPGFFIRQINRSLLFPGAIKGWHLHLSQDDLWYVPAQSHLLIGLWDVRKGSKTAGVTQRIIVGNGKETLVYIPKGVAHGGANVSNKPAHIIYVTNVVFDKDNPDEHRIPFNANGEEFWFPQKD